MFCSTPGAFTDVSLSLIRRQQRFRRRLLVLKTSAALSPTSPCPEDGSGASPSPPCTFTSSAEGGRHRRLLRPSPRYGIAYMNTPCSSNHAPLSSNPQYSRKCCPRLDRSGYDTTQGNFSRTGILLHLLNWGPDTVDGAGIDSEFLRKGPQCVHQVA